MKFLIVLSCFVASALAQSGCWDTGCQADNWAVKGCGQYSMTEKANKWCQGGKIYTCCPASSAPAPAPAPAPVSGGSVSSGIISQAEFNCAAQTKGGNPAATYYTGFTGSLSKSGISSKAEAAKFLAHSVWETVGFIYTKEVYCQTNDCRAAYPANAGGRQDKVYYGRGMLQLTWDYNYKAASQALYNDNRLIDNPEQVADNPAIGWDTAAWFWKTNVHANSATFGGTLKAINGALECDGGSHAENRILRFNHYKEVLKCLNIAAPADSDGYCHA
jgi:predicted chitinase